MTPEALVANGTALVTALMLPLGGLAGVVAILMYGYGKLADSPRSVMWAKGAAVGAVVLFAGPAAVSLLQNISSRLV